MKKTLLTLLVVTAAVTFTNGVVVAEVQSLRGAELDTLSAKPARMKLMEVKGGIERSYKEQPPMVPHEVDKYGLFGNSRSMKIF